MTNSEARAWVKIAFGLAVGALLLAVLVIRFTV